MCLNWLYNRRRKTPLNNMEQKRIVIAGGSGFIGTALAASLAAQGYAVVILSRSPKGPPAGVREAAWDGKSPGPWVRELEGAAAIINLAGRSINCAHTPENVREIIRSRVDSVRAIAAGMATLTTPPAAWVQASATGFYGDTGDQPNAESAPSGKDLLADICRQWEGGITPEEIPQTRLVTLRIGFVLGQGGGAFPVLSGLTKYFLGGAAGDGRQYISWIHRHDLIRIFSEAVVRSDWRGVYNATSPTPVTNADFMRTLREVMHRPWSPPAPAVAVRLGARLMGSEGSLALTSQRCPPVRLLASGFTYQFPELRPALAELVAEQGHAPK